MEAFIVTVHNPRLQEQLERAISGRGAFRYFKDMLLDYPAERECWFQFKRERLHHRMLRLVGVSRDNPSPIISDRWSDKYDRETTPC